MPSIPAVTLVNVGNSGLGSPSAVPDAPLSDGNRVLFWDVLRGVGILLVVYGHVVRGLIQAGILPDGGLWRQIDIVLYSFHMPLFFVIAGRFFPSSLIRDGGVGYVTKRLGTIVYPYVLWSVLQGTIEVLVASHTNSGSHPAIARLLWQPFDQFWFLYALFYVTVAASVIYSVSRRSPWPLVAIGLVAYYLPLDGLGWSAIPYTAHYLLYFALGALSSSCALPRPGLRVRTIVLLVTPLALLFLNGPHLRALGDPSFRVDPTAALCAGLAGTALCCCLAGSVPQSASRVLAFLGKYSLQIFLMHIIFASGARIVLAKGMGVHAASVQLCIGLLAGTLLPVAVAVLAERRGWVGLFSFPLSRGSGRRVLAERPG